MQVNKHGILVQQLVRHRKKKRVKPKFKLGQVTLITYENGIEVSVVLPNFSPVINLLKDSGWREAQ